MKSKQKKSDLCKFLAELPILLLDKSAQSELSHISLVQVDLEQIKYIIQSNFLDQSEMQSNR